VPSNYVEILVKSRDQAKPDMDDLKVKLNDLSGRVAEARILVEDEAAAAKLDDLQAKLLRLDRTTSRPKISMDQAVRAESSVHALEAAFAGVQAKAEAAAQQTDQSLDQVAKKAKSTAGGVSPLLVGMFTAAATVGPAAILAGVATAVVGASALITKGNTQLQASYAQLGQKASAAIQDAAAPLIPQLYASVGVLEQGLTQVGPELKSVFAAVAPEATELSRGIVSLASNALPGLASGLRASAPYAHDLAVDLGKLGAGAGGFFQGLGLGAAGGAAGLNALIDVTQALLVDIGKIAGGLSGGLGPALHDVANAAIPVANALADVVAAIPPHVIESAALATGALFAAFKIGTMAGVVAEGTSFLKFLVATPAAEAAVTAETETASVAMRGLGLAVDAALGPLGLIAGAVTLYGLQSTFATGSLASFTDRVKAAVAAQQQQKQVVVDAAAAQVTATANVNNQLATQQQLLAQAAGKAGDNAIAALSFASAQGGLNDALVATIGDYNLAQGAASAYKTALDALYGKYQSYSDAQATFTTDLANAATGLKAGKDGFDVNTTAGAANYKIMSQLFTAGEDRAESLLSQTKNQQLANQSLQQAVTALDNTARQAHFTQGQIDALNIALTGTKDIGSIQVPIGANIQPAVDAVGRLIRYIDNSAAYVQVGASGTSVGGHQLLAHGGISGMAATGGPRGNLTLVNEQGPELLDLPPGTQVHSHPDSQQMLEQAAAAGSRSGGMAQIEWVGGNAGDEFMAWLRKNIRVRGGNVQTVLGH
jgi:hypothetical protein